MTRAHYAAAFALVTVLAGCSGGPEKPVTASATLAPTSAAPATSSPSAVDRDYSPTVGFTAAEATAMLAAAATGDKWLGEAAPPMAAMLVDLGLRVSELCSLDAEHIGQRDDHHGTRCTGS
ncbi:hypothetical protein [Micromonospora inositola]|uniref:hypothetical protein n=1 Tax=Micromonospora inositola TaxID=47865 RepID=UPI000B5AD54D|nr:hypothetical protein [Micromonospora inositola]